MHRETVMIDHGRLAPALAVAPGALTLEDVLELLAELREPHDWQLDDLGMIRAVGTVVDPAYGERLRDWEFSPLTALCYALTGLLKEPWLLWDEAAAALGLPLAVASALVEAEDGSSQHDAALRTRLLRALGLGEEA